MFWRGWLFLKVPLLVAIDVKALYSSIPHKQGLYLVASVLQEQEKVTWQFNEFLLRLLRHILHCNLFSYSGSHFLQVQGTAMWTCCALLYAKLYLGGWQWDLYLGWYRYIYNILIVWRVLVELLYSFIQPWDNNDFNLMFTYAFNSSKLKFFNIIQPDGLLATRQFHK